MQKKKSRFWLFVWSLIPGAGEMYLGFMNMGVSLMLSFVVLIIVVNMLDFMILSFIPMVMYAYCFFHANNLGTLSDAEFYAVQDRYLLGLEGLNSIEEMQVRLSQKYRKIAAVVLIIIGVVMLWDQIFSWLIEAFGHDNYYLSRISYFMRHEFFRIVFALVVIWVGCLLIRGRKTEYSGEEDVIQMQNVSSVQNTMSRQDISGAQDNANDPNTTCLQDHVNEQNILDVQDNIAEQ